MNITHAHICNFSSPVADLKRKDRTEFNVLKAIKQHPRISSFDMGECWRWLQPIMGNLKQDGLIIELESAYPWHKYSVTEAGNELLKGGEPA